MILPNVQAPNNGLLAKAKKVHFYDFNIKIPYKLNIFYIDGFHYKKIKAFKIHCISLVLITTYLILYIIAEAFKEGLPR